jgi:glycosyltransferase involved in cell wall biosynthesis
MRNSQLNQINPLDSNNLDAFIAKSTTTQLPEVLLISSYPPRECGIATYSKDLVQALQNKFEHSFTVRVAALETNHESHGYTSDVAYIFNTDNSSDYTTIAHQININKNIKTVLLQHEFGFFHGKEDLFLAFLHTITKPILLVFHTVLPNPSETLRKHVQHIVSVVDSVIVMTHFSAELLQFDYQVQRQKIEVIAHGTHLVKHLDKAFLKEKYQFQGKKIVSTFGLLSSGKSIETTLDALPSIIQYNPDVLFLIIGKTHPSVVQHEGEVYRRFLTDKIEELNLAKHVRFINRFVPLPELLEFLQLTDIYLFTSKDPNQAVSGTFSYAMSCGCPIISTPIPHANEVLNSTGGSIIDFGNSEQLANNVNQLFSNPEKMRNLVVQGIEKMAQTAWENSAIAHALLFEKTCSSSISIRYDLPQLNLDQLKKMTTHFGIIQFCKINQPDITSGYTLDDNARALISMCQHYELSKDPLDLLYIQIYLDFIAFCQLGNGLFLNYVDEFHTYTDQNDIVNLEDSNGRAIWALGYVISLTPILPTEIGMQASELFDQALIYVEEMHSTRAMAFSIKGLYYASSYISSEFQRKIIITLSDRLLDMYKFESDANWKWFESYLTYANSLLPEALLCAWLATGNTTYKEVAKQSFDFLLSKIFKHGSLRVISNKGWMHRTKQTILVSSGGEQPIDVAYAVIALNKFDEVFPNQGYNEKMHISFNWFLGHNHLRQIMYNPSTGGCYDGLEATNVNINQGAESTVSYLMARLCIEKSTNFGEDVQITEDVQMYEQDQEVGWKVYN